MHLLLFLALAAAPTPSDPGPLSPDGVEVLGFTADGAQVGVLQHGVYDGKGTPWAKVVVVDVKSGAIKATPVKVELDDAEAGEAKAVAQARAQLASTRYKFRPAKRVATTDQGALTGADGSPTGTLTVTAKQAKGGTCAEPFRAELLTVKLDLMDGGGSLVVLAEKRPPTTRACSSGCVPTSTWGYQKSALFVLSCQVPGFEGPGAAPMFVTTSALEYPLEPDL